VGDQGKVISIEPIPATFDFLSHNVNALKLNNCSLFNYAISNKNGTAAMKVPDYKSGGKNFYEASIIRNEHCSAEDIQIQARTIDSLLNNIPAVSFIKCDVEGHELQCIEGAANTIAQYKPAWCIELSSDPGTPETPAHKIFQILKDAGYQAFYFDGKVLRRWHSNARIINCFFLTRKHLGLVNDAGLMEEKEIRSDHD